MSSLFVRLGVNSACIFSETCRLGIGDPFANVLLLREVRLAGREGSCASLDRPTPDPTEDNETVDGLLAIMKRLPWENEV